MTELLALLHGPVAAPGVAGIAALCVLKAAVGWKLLRRWRGRRAG